MIVFLPGLLRGEINSYLLMRQKMDQTFALYVPEMHYL